MEKTKPLTIKGDLAGGIVAGLVPMPGAMALGGLVLTPLGPEYMPIGIVAGLVASAVSNIVGAFSGGVPFMSNTPYSLTTYLLLSALELILLQLNAIGHYGNETAIILLFFTVFLSGIFQVIIGFLHLGELAKFIPYPVLAGVINGTAILIVISQLKLFLGLGPSISWPDVFSQPDLIQPLTFIVGTVVCLSIWLGPKLSDKIPSPVYGIIFGVSSFYLLQKGCGSTFLGPVIGSIPAAIPTPRYLGAFIDILADRRFWPLFTDLTVLAIGIALVNSLRTLIVCSAGENRSQERFNPNQELLGQGMGNLFSAIFGGISTTGSLSSALANYQYGGRTMLSRAVSGVVPLLVLVWLHPFLAYMPNVVLAAILVMIALASFDKWSFGQLSRIPNAIRCDDLSPLINFSLMLTVAISLMALGAFEALGVGLLLSTLWFVLRQGNTVIHHDLHGNQVRSNTMRSELEYDHLVKFAEEIRLLKLEGALFFGTADKVVDRVEQLLRQNVSFVVLDFARVSEIDSTAAKLIDQLMDKCQKMG